MSHEPEKPRPPPKWVTAEDIVDEFGVSSSTAYEWLKQMPHFREGRIIRASRSAYEGIRLNPRS